MWIIRGEMQKFLRRFTILPRNERILGITRRSDPRWSAKNAVEYSESRPLLCV